MQPMDAAGNAVGAAMPVIRHTPTAAVPHRREHAALYGFERDRARQQRYHERSQHGPSVAGGGGAARERVVVSSYQAPLRAK